MPRRRRPESATDRAAVEETRRALLEGVGAEIASSFPGITRLGGQIVAALYLAAGSLSMDALAAQLERSKSNVFLNLRALEAAGIVERRREAAARHDAFSLRGPYPDVVIGAFLGRLRRVVADKQSLVKRALATLDGARGAQADALRTRLAELERKYDLFAALSARVLPLLESVDVEALLSSLSPSVVDTLAAVLSAAARAPVSDSRARSTAPGGPSRARAGKPGRGRAPERPRGPRP